MFNTKKMANEDLIRELKYAIVEKLVAEGIIADCTDTDWEDEIDCENAIEEVLIEKLG
jgi:hypothetical protein